MIDKYLATDYVKHGRHYPEYDCYGIVRDARAEMFGRSVLPSYQEIDPADKGRLTAAAFDIRERHEFAEVRARPGAIATAWRAKLCVHVGLVVEADARLWILETDEGIGPSLTRLSTFESRYTRVVYYDN